MGISNSRDGLRSGLDVYEAERPGTKPLNISDNICPDIRDDHLVSMGDTTASSNCGTNRSNGQSLHQVKNEAQGSLEIIRITEESTTRTLSRKRHVNMVPLRRLCLRNNNGRSNEQRLNQQTIEGEEIHGRAVMCTTDTQEEIEVPCQSTDDTENYVPLQNTEELCEEPPRDFLDYHVLNVLPTGTIRIRPSNYSDAPGIFMYREDGLGLARRYEPRQVQEILRATTLQGSSNQDFQEDIEPMLLLYNGRVRLSNRMTESRNLFHEEFGQHRRNRILNIEDRRRRFRSQVWAVQRLSTHLDQLSGRRRPYVVGIRHASTRESPRLRGEMATRASISRMLMLAETLFQVLDDIHRQAISDSQTVGLSLGYLPAPDSVVESIPSKVFQKVENDERTIPQCHVCLMEYEDGEQLRVLPCGHEYHMICIDKWLKEVHRICPLCRRDVCELQTC